MALHEKQYRITLNRTAFLHLLDRKAVLIREGRRGVTYSYIIKDMASRIKTAETEE